MTRFEVHARENGFGAEVRAPSLAAIDDATLARLRSAWLDHGVIALPDQPLTHAQFSEFSGRLGEFGDDPFLVPMGEHPHVVELRREADERVVNFGAGWHSDWSFQRTPPSATLLHSKIVPPVGGDTVFADCQRAWRALAPEVQQCIASLIAIHSAAMPYGPDGTFAKETAPRATKIRPGPDALERQRHPLVRRHGETGEPALFVNPVYTVGIEGMADADARALLAELYAVLLDPAHLLRHRWQPDMLLIWDNRRVVHFADGGYDGHLRVMHRVTIRGEAPRAFLRATA